MEMKTKIEQFLRHSYQRHFIVLWLYGLHGRVQETMVAVVVAIRSDENGIATTRVGK